MQVNPVVIFILLGLLAVILIATLGAVASRTFHFRYTKLSLVSFILYTLVGYGVGSNANIGAVIIAAAVIGLFESTVGWQLCLRFGANLSAEELQLGMELPAALRVIMTMIVAVVCGCLGYWIAT